MGSYLGLIVEQRYMDTRKYRQFNKTSFCTTLLRVIVCTLVGSPTLVGIIATPSKGIHWATKLMCKTVIPISLGNFYLFSCSKYFALQSGLMNTTIDEDEESEENKKSN